MKTISKVSKKTGNISMVQIETLEGDGMPFIPAASAVDTGDLKIREVRQEGSVNTLLAINLSDYHCLLSDMDLLKGSKQNRVVNTSVLLAPNTKQEIQVSCVERSRWSYDSPEFSSAPSLMDSKMRAAKAASLHKDMEGMVSETQSRTWDLINQEMTMHHVFSITEDYTALLRAKPETEGYSPGKAEAFYRLDEFLDEFESKLSEPVSQGNGGVGEFCWSGDSTHPGFRLSY